MIVTNCVTEKEPPPVENTNVYGGGCDIMCDKTGKRIKRREKKSACNLLETLI